MTHPIPYPRCIFCGARADSREHAIPKWMSKRFQIRDMLVGRAGNLPERKQPISFASHRRRIFCAGCNRHFKHLEDAALPLIVPMATGRTLSLGDESQAVLSLWAAKTAMALTAATPGLRELVPKEHRDPVRNLGEPPQQSWVGYVPWRGRVHLYTADNDLTVADMHPAPGHGSYSVIFAFKRLAFMFVGFLGGIPDGFSIGSGSYPVRQFWPQQPGLIHWPPTGEPATEADMQNLIRFTPLVRS